MRRPAGYNQNINVDVEAQVVELAEVMPAKRTPPGRPTGFSLAHPLSTGIARRLRGNDGVYAVIDQQLYRPPGGDANSGSLLFGRAAYSASDRSLNDF